jgi:hypothetical protein
LYAFRSLSAVQLALEGSLSIQIPWYRNRQMFRRKAKWAFVSIELSPSGRRLYNLNGVMLIPDAGRIRLEAVAKLRIG